jgi:F-type H+-transporting ATPase subunit delta
MSDAAVSHVYAQALFQAVAALDSVRTAGRDLDAFIDAVDEQRDLEGFLTSPVVPAAGKRAAVDAICEGAMTEVASFLKILIDRGRMNELEAIGRDFRLLADEQAHRIEVSVSSARPLTQAETARIAAAVLANTGAEPVMRVKVNPALLGGVVIKAGDRLLDGAVKSRLEIIRRRLRDARNVESAWEGDPAEWVDAEWAKAKGQG